MALIYATIPCGHIIISIDDVASLLGAPCHSCGVIVQMMSPNEDLINAIKTLKKEHAITCERDVFEATRKSLDELESSVQLCFNNARKLGGAESMKYIERHIPCLISEHTLKNKIEIIEQMHNENYQIKLKNILLNFFAT